MKRRNLIIIAVIVGVALILGFTILLINRKRREGQLVEKPIPQKSLSLGNERITITINEKDSKKEVYPLYLIEKSIKLEKVRELASERGFKLVPSDTEGYHFWKRGEDVISYSETSNILTVVGKDILNISSETEEGKDIFYEIAKNYFDEEWEYEVIDRRDFSDKTQEYKASRKLEDGFLVQMREGLNETDSIQVQDGKIVYARLMLSNFLKTEENVPLLPRNLLSQYLNQKEYPKEIIPEPSLLPNELGVDSYSKEYLKAIETLTDCISDEVSVVYYYKDIDQELLTPIYKILGRCDANYEKKKYQIPVTILTNAVEPKYVLLDKEE